VEQDSHAGFAAVKELAGRIDQRLRQAEELTFDRVMAAL
jgi:hypothetical protein